MTQTHRKPTVSTKASEFRVSPRRVVSLASAQSHLEQTFLQFQLNLAGLQEQLDLELGEDSPKRQVLQEALDEHRAKLPVFRKNLQRLLKGISQTDGSVKVPLNTLLAKLPASEIQKASETDYVLGSIQEHSSEDSMAGLCSQIHRFEQSIAHLHQQMGEVVEVQQLRQLKATLKHQQQGMLQQSLEAFQSAQQKILARQQKILKQLEQDQQRLEQEKAWVKSLLRNLLDQHDRIHPMQSDLRRSEQSDLLVRETALHQGRGWLKVEQSKLRRSLSDPDDSNRSHLLH